MNLSSMLIQLRKMVGNPSTTDVVDTELTTCINDAVAHIFDRFNFNEAKRQAEFPTIAGEDKYALPSDCMALLSVANLTSKVKLTKRGDRWALENISTSQGSPTDYVRYHNWLQLYPIPDGVYSILVRFKNSPVSLSVGTDVPDLPIAWHKGVLKYARHLYYNEVKIDPKMAEYYAGDFDRWVATKPSEVAEESVDIDTGVSLPTLSQTPRARYDFDHSD